MPCNRNYSEMKLLLVCILALVFVAQEAKAGLLKSKRSAQEDFAAAADSSEESNSEESAESEQSDESNESQERVKRDAKSSEESNSESDESSDESDSNSSEEMAEPENQEPRIVIDDLNGL